MSDQGVRTATPRQNATKVMSSSERLRAAASISPFNTPSCMAVRRGTGSALDNSPTLAAIAGPMGITVVDIKAPQRPWLVLNYASTIYAGADGLDSQKGSSVRGGISTMAFQPGRSCANSGREDNIQSSNSILLATARGSGILIWDCSGRALSPLLGRLNASDAWRVGISTSRNNQVEAQTGKGDNEDTAQNQRLPQPPSVSESTPASVIADRKSSVMSVSSSSSQGTSNVNSGAPLASVASETGMNTSNNTTSKNITKMSKSSPSSGLGVVTSLAWKGPSEPILLATVGSTACLFDLRTCLYSGAEDTSSARPYARFTTDSNDTMIHCSYSHDEALHIFATLDSAGVVHLWDDRKCSSLASANSCFISFVAHTQAGVGIAALPPPCHKDDAEITTSRWVTWGLDKPTTNLEASDNLIVKVWDSLPAEHGRTPTMSTVSDDGDEMDESESGWATANSYQMTSHITTPGAVAARTHPSIPDGLLLFRSRASSLSESTEPLCPVPVLADKALVVDGSVEEAAICESPIRTKKELSSSLNLTLSPDTPQTTSVPLHVSTSTFKKPKRDWKDQTNGNTGGWEAQIMQLGNGNIEKVASFRGGSDVDVLSLALGSGTGDTSKVIAVDLAADREPLLCCLTERAFCVYEVPELFSSKNNVPLSTGADPKRVTLSSLSTVPRVYKKKESLTSWWNQSDSDLFGDVPATRIPQRVEDESSLHASGRNLDRGLKQFDMDLATPLPIVENITNLVAAEKNSSSQDEIDTIPTTINEVGVEATVVIDLSKAKQCPCPPLCGIAFGRAGKLVTFNNGPVKKMWSWYQTSPTGIRSNTYAETLVLKESEVDSAALDSVETNEQKAEDHVKSETPRTLFDLIEMTSAAKIAQWGMDDNDESNDSIDGSSDSSSTESSDGDPSYEGSSDESAKTSQSEDSDGFCHVSHHKSLSGSFASKFDNYFASSRTSLTNVDQDSSFPERPDSKQFALLTSLAPSVLVTNRYDNLVLNGQSPSLAHLLELGDSWWLLGDDFSSPKTWEHTEKTRTWSVNSPVHNVNTNFTAEPSHESSRSASMMGNLRKISPFPSVTMTPPDQRLLRDKRQQIPPSADQSDRLMNASNKVALGMYMKENPQTPEAALERFAITRNVCLRNARILGDIGEKAKADTWILLAQAVQSMQAGSDDFDGWGGCNDALTSGLVEQIFRYYEGEGDYQMLATMVCVLTLGKDRRSSKGQPGECSDKYKLLPQRSVKDEIRFDNYLRRYADLLYSWQVLTVRNEISKRMAYAVPGAGGEIAASKETIIPNDGVAIGIMFSAFCQKCKVPVGLNTDVCNRCQNYAFQCSICCSAVRGACTFCPRCGHGGHLDHIITWFKRHQTCPTGCGCVCMITVEDNVATS